MFVRNRLKFLKSSFKISWILLYRLYCFVTLSIPKNNFVSLNKSVYKYFSEKKTKDFYLNFIFCKNFLILDSIFIFFFKKKYENSSNLNVFRSFFRVLSTKQGFYNNFSNFFNKPEFLHSLKSSVNYGLKNLWVALRLWLICLTITTAIVYYSMVVRCLPFSKTLFVWIVLLMFSYWLFSGFVFFVKKYQFGKYTSVIQRFWRRSYILFWLLEFCVFGVYLYLTINANQESFYMFDQIQVFKTHLFSWRSFLIKLFPLTFLLIFGYLFLLSLKWNVFGKHVLWLAIITFLLTYVVWVEFYQFFHVVNYYGNLNWVYDIDERNWTLELEPKKTRTVNHYVMFMLILKFWHIVFIFGFWAFFVLRSVEIGRIRYPMLSANLQNFVILYLFAWVVMYPWLKFVLRHYMDVPYYWFYINNRELGIRVFFSDIKLFYYGLVDFAQYNFNNLSDHFGSDFFYWTLSNIDTEFSSYRKSVIKNNIISSLSN